MQHCQSNDIKRQGERNWRSCVICIAQSFAFASDGRLYGFDSRPGSDDEANASAPAAIHVARYRDDKNYVFADLDTETICQAAMNIAAIIGPITKPLIPKVAMPPSVEISTT